MLWKGKNGYIARKRFGEDFEKALDAYSVLLKAGKKYVTLHCDNAGFRPPDRIVAHEVVTWQVVRRRGKKFKKKVVDIVDEMFEYNSQGIWWCPYCVKLRRFQQDPNERARVVMYCPVCEITNYNWYVKRWNPQAKTLEHRGRTRGKRTTTRRRSVRRGA